MQIYGSQFGSPKILPNQTASTPKNAFRVLYKSNLVFFLMKQVDTGGNSVILQTWHASQLLPTDFHFPEKTDTCLGRHFLPMFVSKLR